MGPAGQLSVEVPPSNVQKSCCALLTTMLVCNVTMTDSCQQRVFARSEIRREERLERSRERFDAERRAKLRGRRRGDSWFFVDTRWSLKQCDGALFPVITLLPFNTDVDPALLLPLLPDKRRNNNASEFLVCTFYKGGTRWINGATFLPETGYVNWANVILKHGNGTKISHKEIYLFSTLLNISQVGQSHNLYL